MNSTSIKTVANGKTQRKIMWSWREKTLPILLFVCFVMKEAVLIPTNSARWLPCQQTTTHQHSVLSLKRKIIILYITVTPHITHTQQSSSNHNEISVLDEHIYLFICCCCSLWYRKPAAEKMRKQQNQPSELTTSAYLVYAWARISAKEWNQRLKMVYWNGITSGFSGIYATQSKNPSAKRNRKLTRCCSSSSSSALCIISQCKFVVLLCCSVEINILKSLWANWFSRGGWEARANAGQPTNTLHASHSHNTNIHAWNTDTEWANTKGAKRAVAQKGNTNNNNNRNEIMRHDIIKYENHDGSGAHEHTTHTHTHSTHEKKHMRETCTIGTHIRVQTKRNGGDFSCARARSSLLRQTKTIGFYLLCSKPIQQCVVCSYVV